MKRHRSRKSCGQIKYIYGDLQRKGLQPSVLCRVKCWSSSSKYSVVAQFLFQNAWIEALTSSSIIDLPRIKSRECFRLFNESQSPSDFFCTHASSVCITRTVQFNRRFTNSFQELFCLLLAVSKNCYVPIHNIYI